MFDVNTVIETGKYEIVESGMFFLDSLESEVLIRLAIDGEFFGNIRVCFVTSAGQNTTIRGEMQEDTLMLTCVNFNSEMGEGTIQPIAIGDSDGKNVMFHMWMYSMGKKKVRKIEYSVFREL